MNAREISTPGRRREAAARPSRPRLVAWTRLGATALLVASATSCALTSKSDPVTINYYSPEPASLKGRPRAQQSKESGPPLRLGRVDGGSHLEEKIVFRSSEHQLGFYDQHRWTEEPAECLERALARELFETRGLSRVVSGRAPTLEVELVSFEEVRVPRHVARVRVILVLHDEREVGLQETLTFERPLAEKTDMNALAAALGAAMRDAVAAVADRVTARLERERAEQQAKAASGAAP